MQVCNDNGLKNLYKKSIFYRFYCVFGIRVQLFASSESSNLNQSKMRYISRLFAKRRIVGSR